MSADASTDVSAVVVLVAGPGDGAKDARGVLEAWAAEGLLQDALWVDAPGPGEAADGEVTASTLTGAHVPLFRALARSTAQTVRLVHAQFVPAAPEPGGDPPAAARDLEAELRRLLADTQELRTVNVLIPSVLTSGLTSGHLIGRWDANVLVAPEDRVSDRQADQRVSPDGNYAAHAAAACATVAGLWRGMTGGPFDERRADQRRARTVITARGFGRVLLAHGLVHQLLGELARLREAGAAALARSAGGVPAADPERTVARAAEDFAMGADEGSLPPRPSGVQHLPAPVRPPGMLRTLGAVWAARQAVGPMPGAPPDAWAQLSQIVGANLADWARTVLRREAGAWEVRTPTAPDGGEPGERAADAARTAPVTARLLTETPPRADETAKVSADMRELLEDMGEGNPPPERSPALWQEFRAACFGLADGGDLPECVQPPTREGRREVILDAELVAPTPGADQLDLTEFLPPETTAGADASGSPTASPTTDFDVYSVRRVRDWLESEVGAQAGTPGGATAEAPGQAEARAAGRERLSRWLEGRKRSFATAVATHLATWLATARTDVTDHLRAVGRDHDADRHQRAWTTAAHHARRWLVALAGTAVAGAALGALLLATGWWSPRPALAVGVGVPALAAALAVGALASARQQLARHAQAHARAVWSYAEHVLAVRHWARETHRLADLTARLRDWSEVVAHVLHDRGGEFGDRYDRPREPGAIPHSLAFRFGAGEQTPASAWQLRNEAVRHVFSRGWLSRVYLSCVAQAEPILRLADDATSDDTAFGPDGDAAGRVSPGFLRLVRNGIAAVAWALDAGSRLVDDLGRKPVADVFPQTRPLDDPTVTGTPAPPDTPAVRPAAREARPTLDWTAELVPSIRAAGEKQRFNAALWTPAGAANHGHHVHQTHVWGLPGDLDHTVPVSGHPLLPPVLTRGSCVYAALRLDLSEETPFLHLSVFEERKELEHPEDDGPADIG